MENEKPNLDFEWNGEGFTGYHRDNGDCIGISQHPKAKDAFAYLINEENFSQVIEIGTGYGGITLIVRDLLDARGFKETPILTYDTGREDGPPEIIAEANAGANIKFSNENLFSSSYLELASDEVEKHLNEYIGRPGTTLVLCDGGCKSCEVRALSKFLKNGDVIMAHDYAPNNEYWEEHMKDKIWNWAEIQDSAIQEALDTYNVKPYMREHFLKVAWYCGKVEK